MDNIGQRGIDLMAHVDGVLTQNLPDRLTERGIVRRLALDAGQYVRADDLRLAHDSVRSVLFRCRPFAGKGAGDDIAERTKGSAGERAADARLHDIAARLSARIIAWLH